MGCGMSTEEKEGKARNEEIENQLKRDRMQQRNEIKMLLLGTFRCCPPWGSLVRHAPGVTALPSLESGLTVWNRCW
jgi:hypothetical protein